MDMEMLEAVARKDDRLEHHLLLREIENFLYREAEAIDDRRYEDWLDCFADEVRYWVPIRKNLSFDERHRDVTSERDVAWIDDNRTTLEARVYQLKTKVHWAEEPLSRVTHVVSNTFLDKMETVDGDPVYHMISRIIVHRSRMDEAGETIFARRIDSIRRTADGLKITYRKIILDQATLHLKNISFFL